MARRRCPSGGAACPVRRTATVVRPAAEPLRLGDDDNVDVNDIVAGWRTRVRDLLC